MNQSLCNTQKLVDVPSEEERCPLIVGQGLTGLSFERYYRRKNISTATIQLPCPISHGQQADQLASSLAGRHLAITPGLKPQYKELFRRYRISYVSDLDIFLQQAPCQHLFLVTGTNGKTSTVQMLEHCLKYFKKTAGQVKVAGNVGYAMLDSLVDMKKEDIIILELSSFQLYWLDSHNLLRERTYGAITSFAQDHLDWHKDSQQYKNAKQKIMTLCQQTFCPSQINAAFPAAIGVDDKANSNQMHPVISLNTPIVSALLQSYDTTFKADEIKKALQSFKPDYARVDFLSKPHYLVINDAKATNIFASLSLLEQQTWLGKTLWYLGGQMKGQELNILEKFNEFQNIDFAIFGPQIHALKSILKRSYWVEEDFTNLLKKVNKDTLGASYQKIVFSPGGTLQPQFLNYRHSAQAFLDAW